MLAKAIAAVMVAMFLAANAVAAPAPQQVAFLHVKASQQGTNHKTVEPIKKIDDYKTVVNEYARLTSR